MPRRPWRKGLEVVVVGQLADDSYETERWPSYARSPHDRNRLLESQQRSEAQLHAILDAYHPAPAQLFSSIDRNITLAFIAEYPTPQAAARIGEQRMAAFCRRQSYRGRVDPAILAQRLKDNLRGQMLA